jgi:hypothetical protein
MLPAPRIRWLRSLALAGHVRLLAAKHSPRQSLEGLEDVIGLPTPRRPHVIPVVQRVAKLPAQKRVSSPRLATTTRAKKTATTAVGKRAYTKTDLNEVVESSMPHRVASHTVELSAPVEVRSLFALLA